MGYLVCPLCCGRSFKDKKSLKYHLLSWETKICCPECKRRFDSVHELADHLDLETCEQVAFVIHVNNTPDPHGKLIAYGRGVRYEESVVDTPSKLSRHSVRFRQNKSLALQTVKEEELTKPEEANKDLTNSVDALTHCGEVLSKSLCVSHATEAIIKLEQEYPDELVEHFCNSCNCTIQGVQEHIKEFHSGEMVILQNAETEDDSLLAMGDVDDNYSDSYDYNLAPNIEKQTVHDVTIKDLENIQAVTDIRNKANPHGSSTVETRVRGAHVKYVDNLTPTKCYINDQGSHVVKGHSPIATYQSRPTSDLLANKVINTKHNTKKSPKVCGVENISNIIDGNSEIPDVQIIIETDFLQNEKKECDKGLLNKKDTTNTIKKVKEQLDMENNMALPKKKKTFGKEDSAESFASTPTIKVPPKLKKPTLIQAHIMQLLHSKGLNKLKESLLDSSLSESSNEDVLQKLFTAANEYLGDSSPNNGLGEGQNSHIESLSKMKEEDRNIILKFMSDPLVPDAIPIFECDMCNVEFSTAHLFAAHKCKIPMTLCELCGVKFKSNRDLQLHVKSHDPSFITNVLFQRQVKKLLTVPATCDVCKTEFTSERGLKIHQRMHRPDNLKKVAEMNNKVEYRCDICNAILYCQRTLKIHNKIHFETQLDDRPSQQKRLGSQPSNRQVGLLACKMCKESFSSNADLKTHWQDHCSVRVKSLHVSAEETTDQINLGRELFTCNICGEQIAENLWFEHEQTHLGDSPLVCKDCNHPFSSEIDLKFHMSVHNTNMELACLTCKTKFTDATLLKIHMKTHAGADQPYPCGFCGKYFSKPHEKVKHERVHTGEKPYECPTCGMRFRVSYLLNVHKRIHSGIRPYTCKQCSKTFRSSSNYLRHIRIHSNIFAYSCPYCPKKFKTGVQLAGHKKIHTKPYYCPQCARRFSAVYQLRAHVNCHNKNSLNHNCHICSAAYARAYALNDHMKVHGKNMPLSPEEEEDSNGMEVANEDFSN